MTTKAQRDAALNANDLLAKAKELQEELGSALRSARYQMNVAGMDVTEISPVSDAAAHVNHLALVINCAREGTVKRAQQCWHVDFLRTDMAGIPRPAHSWEGPANDEFDALNQGAESARAQGITGYDTTRIRRI